MIGRRAEEVLNRAVRFAFERSHEYFTLEHVLLSMLEDSNILDIISACGGSYLDLQKDLEDYLDREVPQKDSSEKPVTRDKSFEPLEDPEQQEAEEELSRHPVATLSIQRLIQRALFHVQSAGKDEINPEDLLVALFQSKDSYAIHLLKKYGVERLDVLNFISHGVVEKDESDVVSQDQEEGASSASSDSLGSDQRSKSRPKPRNRAEEALDQFCIDLNQLAERGKIDPLVGRAHELERMVQTLCRRRKNNPLLVGEAGVGKTALAEGLALRIVDQEVPKILEKAKVYSLDLGSLLAGAKFRGDFEARLKKVLKGLEAKKESGFKPILFIDEIHTIIGAGSVSGGVLDAANLLKPFLSRGEVQCIGSTTYGEYRNVFEKDHALARRFQKIDVNEPTKEEAIQILEGLKPKFEEHHEVRYSKEAIRAAVELSSKHITDRFLPDKAIDVMDEVGARARILSVERQRQRESSNHDESPKKDGQSSEENSTLKKSAESQSTQKNDKDQELKRELTSAESQEFPQDPASKSDPLGTTQLGSKPKLIEEHDIEELIAKIARIPQRSVSHSQKERLKNLERDLKLTIYGQDHAVQALVTAIRLSRSGLRSGEQPVGSFLFCGPTGVGKTELSKQLAKLLGIQFLRFDMSEYMEKHTVSRLIGAPPGYVGFEQAGLLTDAVTKNPHSVILLDEIEKAHPDLWNILLQVMDHGFLTDNNGKKADFRNVILIMTSNVGSRESDRRTLGIQSEPMAHSASRKEVERTFSPEFRNRLDSMIYFNPLDPVTIAQVVGKQLLELESLLWSKNVEIEVDEDAREWLSQKGYDPKMGARPMARLIQEKIKKPLSEEILFGQLEHGGTVRVKLKKDELKFEIQGNPKPRKAQKGHGNDDDDGGKGGRERKGSGKSSPHPFESEAASCEGEASQSGSSSRRSKD